MSTLLFKRWTSPDTPTKATLMQLCEQEGLSPYQWSNGPNDVYSAHKHSYDKVIYVVSGSITFGLPEDGREILLNAGDRIDLPAETVHNAVVGPQGVTCLEAHL